MNKQRFGIFLTGLLLAIAIALGGHFYLACLLWIAFDSCLAPRTSRCWVNSLGTLNSALILQEALPLLFTERPELKYFSTGFTDEKGVQALYNQQVLVRTLTVPTAGNFLDAAAASTTVDVPVTLNQWNQVYLSFTAAEYSSTNRDLIKEQAQPVAVSIGNKIVDTIATLFTAANFPKASQKIVKGAGWDYTHLTAVRSALQKRGVPKFNRFYLVNTDVYTSLLNDPMIVAFFNNPQNKDAIMKGELPDVAGLRLGEYSALPTTGNLVGFAGGPDSVVVAARAPMDPATKLPGAYFPGNIGYITDPKSQFSVRVTEWISPDTMVANVRVDWIWGYAVGQADSGQLTVSA